MQPSSGSSGLPVTGALNWRSAFLPGAYQGTYIDSQHADVAKDWRGFSGFKLLWPLNEAGKMDEVAVFQGASYFRSVGRDQASGLSARGLALKVGDPAVAIAWPREPTILSDRDRDLPLLAALAAHPEET